MLKKVDYIKDMAWVIVNNLVKIIGGLIVGVWVANYLGSEDYGQLSYALVIAGLFLFLVNIGVGNVFIKKLIDDPSNKNKYLGSAWLLKVVGAIIAFLGANFTVFISNESDIVRLMTLLITVQYFFQSFDVINFHFQSAVKQKYYLIANSISFTISSIVKIYFIKNNYNVSFFALAYLIDAIIFLILRIIFYSKYNNILKWTFDRSTIRSLLMLSWPIGLSAFLGRILNHIDKVMISGILNKSELGIYSVSTDLTEPLSHFPTILISSIVPYFFKMKKDNVELYKKRFFEIMNISIWTMIIISTIFSFSSEIIINNLYNDSYYRAILPFALNSWKILFIFVLTLTNIWLVNEGIQKYQLYITSIGAGLNIILNYYLINSYGINGAAISTLFVGISYVWLIPGLFNETRELWVLSLKAMNPLKIRSSIKGLLDQ